MLSGRVWPNNEAAVVTNSTAISFETISAAELFTLGEETLATLSFGVVGLSRSGLVEVYNPTEARMAGLDPARVIGAHFFDVIAQCMNNFMVAQRFEDEPELDDIIPYVLTLRMRPTPVRLRLLAMPDISRRFILIDR
jgi:photoactive yellow protein